MKVYYSPLLNGFLLEQTASDYNNDDLIEISQSTYHEFVVGRPDKIMTPAENGPQWADIPPPSTDELIFIANNEKSIQLATANSKVAMLIDAVELDMATDEEVAQLKAWKVYRVLLTRVDTSTAPDIEWPQIPS